MGDKMTTLTELADRLDRCATLIRLANGVLDPAVLERTAAELRSMQQPVNGELQAALSKQRCIQCGYHFTDKHGFCMMCAPIRAAIDRAEAAEKAPQPTCPDCGGTRLCGFGMPGFGPCRTCAPQPCQKCFGTGTICADCERLGCNCGQTLSECTAIMCPDCAPQSTQEK